MIRPLLILLLTMIIAGQTEARTARRLDGRIKIDGFTTHEAGPADTSEWDADERIFGLHPGTGDAEESIFDSKWGADNDVSQIRITWDKDSLYVGGDAVIWGNNLLIWLDLQQGIGLPSMFSLNSWRRGFAFSGGFDPDLFCATWDGNTSPHLVLAKPAGGNLSDVLDLTSTDFRSIATFSGNLRGRAMEFAIPWNTVMLGVSGGLGSPRVFVPTLGDSVSRIPSGARLRIAAAVTGGQDGTGGPDSAPDKTGCHVSDANQTVTIDNYVEIILDALDDTGLGGGGPDGVADFGVSPRARARFRFQPPIRCKPLQERRLTIDRPAFAPDRGEQTRFTFDFKLQLDPTDQADQLRTIVVEASVHSLSGERVRGLYTDIRLAIDQRDRCEIIPGFQCIDVWDGRDDVGRIVAPGTYVIRVALREPFQSRLTRPVVVAR